MMTPRQRIRADIGAIAAQYNITCSKVLGPSRIPPATKARQHCYWYLRQQGKSYPEIGRIMNRDHSSVLHGVRKHIERNTPLPSLAGYSEGLI